MEAEYLHARFGVGIVCWLELKLIDAEFLEEFVERTDQIAESEIVIGDYAFDLMKLGEMRSIERLVTEYTIDAEVPYGLEFALKQLR